MWVFIIGMSFVSIFQDPFVLSKYQKDVCPFSGSYVACGHGRRPRRLDHMCVCHFACSCASGHLSLAEVNLFPRFLLRGTQGGRRNSTAHPRGSPVTRGARTRRPKLKIWFCTKGTSSAPQKPSQDLQNFHSSAQEGIFLTFCRLLKTHTFHTP